MKVRFIKPLFVGVRTYAEGEVGEFEDARAAELVKEGHAKPVKGEQIETATTTQPPVETATVKTRRRGK